MYLLDEINKLIILNNAPLSQNQRCAALNRLAITLSPRNKLNFMIYDGELLYVHKNMRDTLFVKRLTDGYIFSTQPLDDTGWRDFPLSRMMAYKDGECVFEGTNHEGEFIPTLEYINAAAGMNI